MAVLIHRAAARDLLLLCSGVVLYIAAFFPAVWGSTAWLAVCPFYLALSDKTPTRGFWVGAMYGLLMSAGLAGWASAIESGPFSPEMIGTLARLGLSFGLSYGFVAALSCLLLRSDWPLLRWMGMPAVWVSGELVRTSLQAGFHWDLLGYTQYQILPLIQIADVTGVYGLSFLLALSGYVVAECVMSLSLQRPFLPEFSVTKRFSLSALNGLGFGVLLTLLYGMTCLSHYPTLTLALPSAPTPFSSELPEFSQPLIEVSLRHRTPINHVYDTHDLSDLADPSDLTGGWYREQWNKTPFRQALLSSEVQQPHLHTPSQHPCAAPSFLPITFQAIATRQPFWPQDATGQLGFVDPAGRCYVLSREEARMVLRHTSLKSVSTLYTQYGDWFVFACFGFGLMALVRGRKPRLSTQNVSTPGTHHAAVAAD